MTEQEQNQPEKRKKGKKQRKKERRQSGKAQEWNDEHKGTSPRDRLKQHAEHAPKATHPNTGARKLGKHRHKWF